MAVFDDTTVHHNPVRNLSAPPGRSPCQAGPVAGLAGVRTAGWSMLSPAGIPGPEKIRK